MSEGRNIYIKNIYYMLCYAFRSLKEEEARKVEAEEFSNTADLLAEVLLMAFSHILRRGIYKEFATQEETMRTLRGRLNLEKTLAEFAKGNRSLNCDFDEFSEDNLPNRILLCTFRLLASNPDVSDERKGKIRNALRALSGVSAISPKEIRWSELQIHGKSREYRFVMSICRFVLSNMIMTTSEGSYLLSGYAKDEAMCRLYEKFILEYYRKHYPYLNPNPSQVDWDLEEGVEVAKLPTMVTDISLYQGKRRLIIDAKFYSRETVLHQGKETYRSGNLYQIFSYVKNADKKGDGSVSGMLLYAKTDADIELDDRPFRIAGNTFSVRQLDLNRPFSAIAERLNSIAEEFTGK